MPNETIRQTVDIVISYLNKNEMPARDLPSLIKNVFNMLQGLRHDTASTQGDVGEVVHGSVNFGGADVSPWKPMVSKEEAVTQDEVVCMICGKRGKALKGHLTRSHKMRLEEYRKAFNLPKDFRMVAPSYSERRRQLAIDAGLGEKSQGEMGGK